MDLWLKARRARLCAITLACVLLAVTIGSSVSVALPVLLGSGRAPVSLGLLSPIAVAVAVAAALGGGLPELERVGVRRVRPRDLGYVMAIAMITLASFALLDGMLVSNSIALEAGRNAAGYVGLAMLGRRLFGSHAAGILPAVYLILASLIRPSTPTLSATWGWMLAPVDNVVSWCTAIGLLMVGAILGTRQRPQG